MNDLTPQDEILQTICQLFELSLAVGGSLDVDECIINFVKKLMVMKNLSQFRLWLKVGDDANTNDLLRTMIPDETLTGLPRDEFVQAYIHPDWKPERPPLVPADHPAFQQALKQGGFSLPEADLPDPMRKPGQAPSAGVCGLVPFGSLEGFIDFRSLARTEPFPVSQLNQMRPLIEKFGTSLAGAAAYQRATREIAMRRVAEEKAVKANAAKTFFLSNMNHEIRTPLNAVMGYAQILAWNDKLDDEHTAFARDLLTQADQLTALFSRLMAITEQSDKLEVVHLEFFTPHDLVDGVLELFEANAHAAAVSLQSRIDDGVPIVLESDVEKLNYVLHQAIENALKFTDEGQVDVVVRWLDEEGGQLEFIVSDTGIGLNTEKVEEAFGLFETLGHGRHSHEGTGIGLTICRRMVNALGGSITLEGSTGDGATLRWRIPCRQPD